MTKALEALSKWNNLAHKQFNRSAQIDSFKIHCDCSGLIKLLFLELDLPLPYSLERPKAVHYFNLLQEIGSSHISNLKPGNLLAWRKENAPKAGDTGHVLIISKPPNKIQTHIYRTKVFDSTKAENGLSERELDLHTNEDGQLVGVRLHLNDTKVKRTPIYHAPIEGSRYCFGCGLPKRICLCSQVEPELTTPPIIIFRHPDERRRTLSTVSLIKQRFPQLLVKEGETFAKPRNSNLTLLFPGGETFEQDTSEKDNSRTYLLIDATWRKAKRILHLNPWISELPKVSLDIDQVSNYLIRKIPNEGALSTVEAFAAISQDKSLGGLFDAFIEKQIDLMGEDVYRKNYSKHLNFRDE